LRLTLVLVLSSLTALTLGAAPRGEPWYSYFVEDRMGDWEAQLLVLEAQGPSPQVEPLFAQVTAAYGFIGWCLGKNLSEKAARHLDWAERAWAVLNQKEPNSARVLALRAGLDGFQLALRPWEAPLRGPKSQQAARQAVQVEPSQPLGWWELGHVDYYAPVLLGGSPERAVASFDRALNLWEAEPGRGLGDWGYLQAAADAVRARFKTGRAAEAQALWSRILAREPRLAAQPVPKP